MPKRNTIPPVMAGRSQQLIDHFNVDYEREVEREKSLPREERFVTNIGYSYVAVGWLLRRDRKYSPPKVRAGSTTPGIAPGV